MQCSTHPDIELDVLVGDSLNVEPNRWDRCDGLTKLQLIENSFFEKGRLQLGTNEHGTRRSMTISKNIHVCILHTSCTCILGHFLCVSPTKISSRTQK